MSTNLLIWVHACEATTVTGMTTLGSNFTHFLLGTGHSEVLVSVNGLPEESREGKYDRLAKFPGLVFWVPDMVTFSMRLDNCR
jgi:hypothetical protein